MAYSRIPFAMAMDGLWPKSVARLNSYGVPRNAVLVSAGDFRIPLGTSGVVMLACLPVAVLLLVIVLGVRDGTYALPALMGSLGGPFGDCWRVRCFIY